MKVWLPFLFSCFGLLCLVPPCYGTDSPVIGILGGPLNPSCDVAWLPQDQQQLKYLLEINGQAQLQDQGNCFSAYYVKWIEAGGGRVVPIRYNSTKEELDYLFHRLNGLVFTGGSLDLSFQLPYVQTANYLFQLATQSNASFPIWGTCQGFQLLHILAAQDASVLVPGFDSEDLSLALNFTSQALTSRMFGSLPPHLQQIFQTERVTINYHHLGILPQTFKTNQKINTFFNSLSTNVDRNGRAFISTVEAKNFPIYATQWHPEREQFEWNAKSIGLVHTLDAIQANAAMGQFFINEARKNINRFESEDVLEKYLIYSFPTYYLGHSLLVYVF